MILALGCAGHLHSPCESQISFCIAFCNTRSIQHIQLCKTDTPLLQRIRLFIVVSVAIVDGSDARNCARNVVEHALDNMRSHPKTCHTGRSGAPQIVQPRAAEHKSELQSLMRLSYAVFCFEKKKK